MPKNLRRGNTPLRFCVEEQRSTLRSVSVDFDWLLGGDIAVRYEKPRTSDPLLIIPNSANQNHTSIRPQRSVITLFSALFSGSFLPLRLA